MQNERKKLKLHKETVRRVSGGETIEPDLTVGDPTLCPTDGTKTCLIAR